MCCSLIGSIIFWIFLICCFAPLHSIFTLYLLCPAHHHPPHVCWLCTEQSVHTLTTVPLKWISDTKIVPLPWLPSTTWRPSGWTGRWSRWTSTGARSCWWRTPPPCEAPPSETLRRWMNFAKRYDEMIHDSIHPSSVLHTDRSFNLMTTLIWNFFSFLTNLLFWHFQQTR